MKNLDLSTYGVEEMNEEEIREMDGGGILAKALGYVCGVVGQSIADMGANYAANPYYCPLR